MNWGEVGERKIYGSVLVERLVERIKMDRQHIKAAQDRQSMYVNKCRVELSFEVGDLGLLEGISVERSDEVGKKVKLSRRYIGPYEILGRDGPVAYHLALPRQLERFTMYSMCLA